MRERINNKFLLCIAGLLIFVCTIQVYADTQQYGSISIALTEGRKGTSRENVEFSCTKVGEIVNGEYRLKEEFLSLSVNFNKIESANDMEDIAEKLGTMDINAERVLLTDKNGKLCFSGLTTGVYFLKATNIEKYEQIKPFLISIPTFNEEGKMNYEIDKCNIGNMPFFTFTTRIKRIAPIFKRGKRLYDFKRTGCDKSGG